MKAGIVVLALLGVTSCGTHGAANGAGQGAGAGTDAGVVMGWDFTPAPSPATPAITLRLASATANQVTFTLVASGVTDLFGVAFRLTYDEAVLQFDQATLSADWPALSLVQTKEVQPGLLLGVVTARGGARTNAPVQELGTLVFSATGSTATDVAFAVTRCRVLGADGQPRAGVQWAGGHLVARTQ